MNFPQWCSKKFNFLSSMNTGPTGPTCPDFILKKCIHWTTLNIILYSFLKFCQYCGKSLLKKNILENPYQKLILKNLFHYFGKSLPKQFLFGKTSCKMICAPNQIWFLPNIFKSVGKKWVTNLLFAANLGNWKNFEKLIKNWKMTKNFCFCG